MLLIDKLGRKLEAGREALAPGDSPFGEPATPATRSKFGTSVIGTAPMIERFEFETEAAESPDVPFPGGAIPVGIWLLVESHAQTIVLKGVHASTGASAQGEASRQNETQAERVHRLEHLNLELLRLLYGKRSKKPRPDAR